MGEYAAAVYEFGEIVAVEIGNDRSNTRCGFILYTSNNCPHIVKNMATNNNLRRPICIQIGNRWVKPTRWTKWNSVFELIKIQVVEVVRLPIIFNMASVVKYENTATPHTYRDYFNETVVINVS